MTHPTILTRKNFYLTKQFRIDNHFRKQIEDISLNNVMLSHALYHHRKGWCTYDEALRMAVDLIVDDCKRLIGVADKLGFDKWKESNSVIKSSFNDSDLVDFLVNSKMNDSEKIIHLHKVNVNLYDICVKLMYMQPFTIQITKEQANLIKQEQNNG